MGLFSKSKPKASVKPKLICLPNDAASNKCVFLANYRKVPVDLEWGEPSSLDDKMSESLNMADLNRYPCIQDGDFTVCGENAVMTYLNIKGNTPTIHPRKARVLAMQQYWIQVLTTKCYADENIDAVLVELEKTLEGNKYIVGEFSLADIHWAATFKALEHGSSVVDLSKYRNINNWLTRMKSEIPGYEVESEKAAA